MARKTEPGITYYPVKTNHTQNSKIRLLFNEFDADGYWIWCCLLCRIYEDKGYYFDLKDADELELFATDVCKKKVSLVNEVIAGCIRRGLFSKPVFDAFNILTSSRIQLNYVEATAERRRKTTIVTFFHEYLLILPEESWKNINIEHLNGITPRNNPITPRSNPQSKEEYSKEEQSKVENGEPTQINEKLLVPEMASIWKKANPSYVEQIKKDFEPLLKIAKFLCDGEQINFDLNDQTCIEKIKSNWVIVSGFIVADNFYKTFNLILVEKHIQAIVQKIQHGSTKQSNSSISTQSAFDKIDNHFAKNGN